MHKIDETKIVDLFFWYTGLRTYKKLLVILAILAISAALNVTGQQKGISQGFKYGKGVGFNRGFGDGHRMTLSSPEEAAKFAKRFDESRLKDEELLNRPIVEGIPARDGRD